MRERKKDKNKNKARSARLHLSRTLQRITQEHGIYSSKEEELEWRGTSAFYSWLQHGWWQKLRI